MILTSLLLLTFFSWWFSGRSIAPIEENRKKQVEFIAAASHELKAPLTVVRASVSALTTAEDPAAIRKFSSAADRECVRMSRLINDLLFLASADANTWSIRLEDIEVDTLLTELFESYEPMAQKKGQHLSLNLPDDLLPIIRGDKQRLYQALSILVDNAISYTPEQGHISIHADMQRQTLVLSVQDDGPGIPDAHKPQIFERFYRIDASRSQKSHYGLGLSIAAEITALHRGRLSVTDTPGGGSTFQIKLEL